MEVSHVKAFLLAAEDGSRWMECRQVRLDDVKSIGMRHCSTRLQSYFTRLWSSADVNGKAPSLAHVTNLHISAVAI